MVHYLRRGAGGQVAGGTIPGCRSVSLFYRAWEKYRLPAAYERARLDVTGDEDLCTWCVYCLAGFGT
jgi:hypothetical protein